MATPLEQQLQSGLAELTSGTIAHRPLSTFLVQLRESWEPLPDSAPRVHEYPQVSTRRSLMSAAPRVRPEPPPRRPPPWYIGMTSAFSNAIIGIDRKLQGRILEAVADLTKNPLEIRGDTVKPLAGELKGCWRYRIGDFRLIYSADRNSGDVTLVAFSPRGSAYKD